MIALISAVETDLAAARAGAALLPPEFGRVAVLSSRDLAQSDVLADALRDVRVVIVRILGGYPYFRDGFDAIGKLVAQRNVQVVAIPGDAHLDPDLDARSTVEVSVLRTIFAYTFAGGAANFAQLFRYVSDVQLGTAFGYEPPEETPEWGFYHPRAVDRAVCARLDRERFTQRFHHGGRGVVGIVFYRADWTSGNLAHIDALIAQFEERGLDVLPVFVYSLRDCDRVGDLPLVYAQAFMREGVACVDVIVSMLSYATSDLSRGERTVRSVGPALRADAVLDVPLIQGVTTSQTYDAWLQSEAGLGPLDAATKVVMPEFDGKIIGPLFAFRDPATSLAVADPSQTRRLVDLAARYVRLRRVPNHEKRIAIVLTNFANRQGRVGSAVGLDTPASVIALLRALAREGYDVGPIPDDGDALMSELLARGGYDAQTLTEGQLASAQFHYDRDAYERWYAEFPAPVRVALEEAWGEPPGDAYRVGEHVYVAGIRFGNVFVMIQPPRGFGENPLAVYHSGDLVPTHHYLGAYRYLRDVFGADAIVQCGKHGTLEWLPGKSLGLSQACYPAIAQSEVPLFYPFIIDDPGEGSQAKRRANACIIDHLVPPMTRAETYDELAKLQRLLGEYAAAERIDPEKTPLIASAIWQSVVAADLQNDLGVEALPEADAFGEFLQHVDGYLCELGDMQIRDGLHVLGEPPQGERLVNLALALVRLDQPESLSLLHAMANDRGIDYTAIADAAQGGRAYDATRTVRVVRETLHEEGRVMLSALLADEPRERVLHAHALSQDGDTARVLDLLCTRIVPDIRRATDEVDNLLAGLRGRHVPPGPSGPPTRGMASVLPTGRNFYAIDVRAIPSRFAWSVGVRLGDALLRSALERDGGYPRSIAMTVWGTANMRTQGDDVAEIFWLLGVRPVWHEENGRVVDLEIIPLHELGRPRIDVTVRISGFFRDSFPGVVTLLDRAVAMVAALDESAEENFVRAATQRDEQAHLAAGVAPDEARKRARFRIFGTRPGSFGTGILEQINAGTWSAQSDLAQTYLASGGFAYGANAYGEPAPVEFRARLAETTIAVQNQDNREHDIFDSDTYLQHHGGMIAAIRELRGSAPHALFGDSSNPQAPVVRDLADEARRVFRSRVANPKWLAGVRRHGYKGALEMAATIDYLFGYDATAGVVEDWMYEKVAQSYLLDEESRAFLRRSNPWCAKEMTERLLEAAARGMWSEPDARTLDHLREELLSLEGALEDHAEPTYV